MFAGCLSQGVVGGFFYSTGYYPFPHYTPTLGFPYTLPTTTHHLLPALTYSGCRNVHGAAVPCALPTPYLTTVAAPAAVAAPAPAAAVAAVEPVAEAPAEAAEEGSGAPAAVAAIEPVAEAPAEAAEKVAAIHDASTPELAVEATAERFIRTVSKNTLIPGVPKKVSQKSKFFTKSHGQGLNQNPNV